MKKSIIHAKYDTAEFVIGDILLVTGGILVGSNFVDQSIVFPLGMISIGIGFFLGLRVLKKFSSTLNATKVEVDDARKKLENIVNDVQVNRRVIQDATDRLQNTMNDLRQTKRQLEQTKADILSAERKMKSTEEKIFGSGGSTFSRSSWAHPIEKEVEELKRTVEQLKREIERSKRGW